MLIHESLTTLADANVNYYIAPVDSGERYQEFSTKQSESGVRRSLFPLEKVALQVYSQAKMPCGVMAEAINLDNARFAHFVSRCVKSAIVAAPVTEHHPVDARFLAPISFTDTTYLGETAGEVDDHTSDDEMDVGADRDDAQ